MRSERNASRFTGWALAAIVVIVASIVVWIMYVIGWALSLALIGAFVIALGAAYVVGRWIGYY